MTAPDERLRCAAELVGQGAVFADIGTDHAYLPLFLLSTGRIDRAVCTDVREGPLDNARRNAAKAGFSDRMTFLRTDGLSGLENLGLTDIAICGMGGELIADILDRAPFVKEGVRLILGPMTRQEHLRSYLASHGFFVTDERYATSDGKYYLTLSAKYTGECRTLDPVEATLGKLIHGGEIDAPCRGYLCAKIRSLLRASEGKAAGGGDADTERAVLCAIEERFPGLTADARQRKRISP